MNDVLFSLLRSALTGEVPQCECSLDNCAEVRSLAAKQCVVGLAYQGACLLPASKRPPLQMMLQWAAEAETLKGHNRLLNGVAARLTQTFAAEGLQSVVLKGPANALLYPDPLARQCGDIDIWVEGGRGRVEEMLLRLGLLEKWENLDCLERFRAYSLHHFRLSHGVDGVEVEVHFKPSSGVYNRLASRRLESWLDTEIRRATVTAGFGVPSIRFALVMQLAHIQRHYFGGGIGLKQIVDYYVLLRNSSEEDRAEVVKLFRPFGFWHSAGAVMWVLEQKLHLEKSKMLCEGDAFRGRMMLEKIVDGGAFGCFSHIYNGKKLGGSFLLIWLKKRFRELKEIRFDWKECLWNEFGYCKSFMRSIPLRIRLRKISLRKLV